MFGLVSKASHEAAVLYAVERGFTAGAAQGRTSAAQDIRQLIAATYPKTGNRAHPNVDAILKMIDETFLEVAVPKVCPHKQVKGGCCKEKE